MATLKNTTINDTGGATWNPGANSINVSNNSGWIFSVLGGNFFLFFN